jgi:hypothetical protein
MRLALHVVALVAALLASSPAPAQHGTLGPVEASKQYFASRGIVVARPDGSLEPRGRRHRRLRRLRAPRSEPRSKGPLRM